MAATIYISPTAFMKMQTLVTGYDKEVGWFGTVEKIAPSTYRVKDILVFPQYTTGSYIDDECDDPREFEKWLNTIPDEIFNERRLWGHSHVNMATFASSTDSDMFQRQVDAISRAAQNRYTLCLIMNKRCEMYWYVNDADEQTEYVNKDINVIFEVEEGVGNRQWFEETKQLVRDLKPTTAFLFRTGSNSYGYKKPHTSAAAPSSIPKTTSTQKNAETAKEPACEKLEDNLLDYPETQKTISTSKVPKIVRTLVIDEEGIFDYLSNSSGWFSFQKLGIIKDKENNIDLHICCDGKTYTEVQKIRNNIIEDNPKSFLSNVLKELHSNRKISFDILSEDGQWINLEDVEDMEEMKRIFDTNSYYTTIIDSSNEMHLVLMLGEE